MIARRFKMALAMSLILVGGCTKKKEGQLALNIHFPEVELKLDPHKMEDLYSMLVVTQLYRGLLRFNSPGDVVPDLAMSYSESEDRKTYKFKLREATFSNGEKVTAKHVQMSFARIFLLGAGIAADLDYIKGTKNFIKSKNINDLGIRPIADNEIEFQLEFPSALFLKQIAVADCAIIPFYKIENPSQIPAVFSGPYKIAKQEKGRLDLVKWRLDNLESKTPPEKISFFPTSESPIQLARSERTDTLDRDVVTSEERSELERKGWGSSPTELTGEAFIILNPEFLSESLRQYLYGKVNQAKLVEILREPHFKAAYGLIPANFPGELLATELGPEIKTTTEYHGKKVSFQFDYDPSVAYEKTTAEYLKSIWTSSLVEVNLNPMTKAEKLKRMFGKVSQSVLGRKSVDYPDGFSTLTYFKGKYDANYFHVNDSSIDASIALALQEFDTKKRSEIYKKIERQILAKYTYVPLFFGSQASGLWSSKVKMVPSHPMGYHTMPFETIEMKSQ